MENDRNAALRQPVGDRRYRVLIETHIEDRKRDILIFAQPFRFRKRPGRVHDLCSGVFKHRLQVERDDGLVFDDEYRCAAQTRDRFTHVYERSPTSSRTTSIVQTRPSLP